MNISTGCAVYIPTGESYLGGLTSVKRIKENAVFTEFGIFELETLQSMQNDLHLIFYDQKAQRW